MLNVLLNIYKKANDNRLLETKIGKFLFCEAYFFYKKHFEDFYIQLLKQHPQVLTGGHIIDVGANIGYTTIFFARFLSPGFKILAIEPHPSNFEKLQENVARYRIEDKVILIQAAVGEIDGEINLWLNDTSHADHRILTPSLNNSLIEKSIKSLKVKMITLNSLSKNYNLKGLVKFVKIDVQGYELSVLEGMKKLLKDNADLKVCLEYAPEMMGEMGFDADKIFEFFTHYSKYLVTRKGLKRFENSGKFDKSQLSKGYADILFSKQEI